MPSSSEGEFTLLVSNLPVSLTNASLRTLFAPHLAVLSAFIVDNAKHPHDTNRIGFVKCKGTEDVDLPALRQKIGIDGRSIRISLAQRSRHASKKIHFLAPFVPKIDDAPLDVKEPTSAQKDARCEVFVRGVPFECTVDRLKEHFGEHFGPVKMAYLVKDPLTGTPKGTAFIEFESAETVEQVLTYHSSTSGSASSTVDIDAVAKKITGGHAFTSMFAFSASEVDKLSMDDRQLLCSAVVDRQTAQSLKRTPAVTKADYRNLALLEESIPVEDTPLRDQRLKEVQLQRRRFAADPNLVVSRTRLSVRRLARTVDEGQLKAFFVKIAKEASLSLLSDKPELLQAAKKTRPSLKQVKIVRATPSASSLKHDEADGAARKEVLGKSRGFGFAEFREPAHALLTLRHLMRATEKTRVWRMLKVKEAPIVEYAIDRAHIVARMQSHTQNKLDEERAKRPAYQAVLSKTKTAFVKKPAMNQSKKPSKGQPARASHLVKKATFTKKPRSK